MKTCTKCNETKELSEFFKNISSKDGYRSTCKCCHKIKTDEWIEANPEKQKERLRKWKNENLEQYKKTHKNRYISKIEEYAYNDLLYTKSVIKRIKQRTKKSNLDFDLDENYLLEKIKPMKCEITGLDLVRGINANSSNQLSPNTLSIDRIDNSKGYVRGNIQVVCLWYNISKNRWSQELILDLIKKTYKNKFL